MSSTALVDSMDVDAAVERLHALKLSSDMAISRNKGGLDVHDHAVRLREQYEAMVLDQTRRSQLAMQENAQLRSMLGTMENQNQALRHTVHALEGYRDKVDEQHLEIQALQQEIKMLKQTNFSLQFYLQQSDHTRTLGFGPRPPDVF
ncbi:Aste57867_23369 [Aphanomyces stellatus]|uniref:Aste57867_23369 protein n=1 Tax=Aphanomyces stellatus TaxID=120398 RepID=A0A485LNJ6_9STRA|nr:hypothetical protein As57867_023298 [Aphanomyces stellatus]VFU00015.1 Aste57867_23369 [Aphanomyces stellatus]